MITIGGFYQFLFHPTLRYMGSLLAQQMHSTANFHRNCEKVAVQCNYSMISYYLCSAMHYSLT